jgi:hypothetical protein
MIYGTDSEREALLSKSQKKTTKAESSNEPNTDKVKTTTSPAPVATNKITKKQTRKIKTTS